jgi:superfamily II DNA or RNA helicase
MVNLAPAENPLPETVATLASTARRKTGSIPEKVLADHIVSVTEGADWPVRKAAMEALLRRIGFGIRDQLVVGSRPPGGRALGVYSTRRAGETKTPGQAKTGHSRARSGRSRRHGTSRPYTTVLEQVHPPRGSCDCADFLRGSLGLCKHLLVVLEDLHASPKRLQAALAEQARPSDAPRTATLRWDPVRPFTGEGDRLLGLWLDQPRPLAALRAGNGGRNGAPGKKRGKPKAHTLAGRAGHEIGRWFSRGRPAREDIARLERRQEFVSDLLQAIERQVIAAEPAARALLVEERGRVERRIECSRDTASSLPHLKSLKRKLYPYQREGVERFLDAGRLLLADDMGLGKTTQAIAACHVLFHSGRVQRGLLIVPASLKPQWLREWQESSAVPAWIVDGSPEERARLYRSTKRGFLIMNYEQLLRDLEHVHRFAPEIVVLDEAQRIKNWATKSSVYVKTLTPRYRLVLTGTPMENRLEELASILDWVDDVALAPKWRLVPWHTRWESDAGKGRTGARNLDTLRTRLSAHLVRRVRREVLTQLPARTDTRVPVLMTEQQREAHDDLRQPIASLLRRAEQRPLTQAEFLKLMQLLTTQRVISNGLGQLHFEDLWPTYSRTPRPDQALLEGLFAPKLHELRRLIGEIAVEQGRKVVVFSQWRRMLRLAEWSLRDVLGDAGLRAVFFTGAERTAQRSRSIVDFHDDPDVRVMLLSDAGGVGLNLQRAASCCINLEMPWNPAVLEQRIGRIYRIGQKVPIDVYNVVSEEGIEARIAALVSTKQAMFSSLFDGTTDEVRFDGGGSFLEGVQRLMEPAEAPALPEAAWESQREAGSEDADGDGASDGDADGELAEDTLGRGDEASATLAARGATEPDRRDASAPAELERALAAGAVGNLFRAVAVQRTPEGGLRLEAPPEAAASLAALFEGMAKMFRESAEVGARVPGGG